MNASTHVLLTVVGCMIASCSESSEPGGATELEGTWVDVSGRAAVLTFAGPHVRFGHLVGTFELHLNAERKQIDMAVQEQSASPIDLRGIYKLEGDTLTISLGEVRPTAFVEEGGLPIGWTKFEFTRLGGLRDEELQGEPTELEGMWVDAGGRPVCMFASSHARFFRLDRVGTFQLNPRSDPNQIDMEVQEIDGSPGIDLYGIYKIQGDQLTMALGQTRPTTFARDPERRAPKGWMKLELTRLEAFRDRKAGGPTELDGTWVIETGGQVFMFAGDHVRFLRAPGTFQLNLKTEPKQIDVAAELDPGDEDVPGTWYGIYKLEGDKLTIALGATRPTAFDEGAMKFELIREEAPRDKRASDPGETASDLLADDGTRWLQVPGPTWVSSLVASGSRLYAGRRGGVLVSSDFGASWSVVAEGLPSNVVVRALGVRDSTVLVCDRVTIYRTHDGAARWSTVHTEPRSRDLGRLFPLAGLTWPVGARDEIPYTPPHGHPRLKTRGTVLRSTDDGKTWERVGSGIPEMPTAFAVLGTKIFASVRMQGVFVSADGGSTWTAANMGLPKDRWREEMQRRIPDRAIPAGVGGFDNFTSIAAFGDRIYVYGALGLYVSADEGATWTNINTSELKEAAAAAAMAAGFSNPSFGVRVFTVHGADMFAAAQTARSSPKVVSGGVYRSTDGGQHWSRFRSGPGFPVTAFAVCGDYIFAGGSKGIWRARLTAVADD